ncbi:MAG: carboxypeptidase regulatory-like domain-containing protein, partial [Gemmatimonadales bacterium]|nr:carboxypeptidase regulatory-like domain-containing protein [Gemmatimonadales bacterium]
PVDGVVFDWAVAGATEDPFRASTVDLGLGAQVLGGSGVLRYTERRFGGETDRIATGSWTRVWHTTPWVRQVRLGEALGSGARPRIVRGAVVTNAPFVRPAAFAVNPLEGMLAPGWEVELYRGLEFIDYARTGPDGRYLFDVPVLYGENPLDVVAYGPNGQVFRDRRTFEVAAERLPAGQFEYGVGGGACAYDLCEATLNVDLRYGIDRRWTVRGGVDRFWRDTLPDLWHPYGSVAFQATRSIALVAEGVGDALVAGRAEYAPTQDFRVTLGQTWFTGDVTLPLIGSEFEDSRTEASFYVRPPWLDYRTYGRLFAIRSRGANVDRDLVSAVATVRFDGARLDAGGTHERRRLTDLPTTARTTVDVRYFQVYGGSVPWLRRTLFRVELRADVDSGPVQARVGFNRGFSNLLQLEMGLGWQRGLGTTFELGITATLRPVRIVSRNRVTPDGTRGIQAIEGSLIWESSTSQLEFADGRSLGRAGIVGEVFVDFNGNGLADPGESRVPNVTVRVGPLAARTDAEGRFAVWDLMPFEPLILEVDANTVRDPLWVPATPRLLVRPDPNTFTPIPVPLVQAGEVSGVVLLGEDGVALRGVQVELRNQDTGDVYGTSTFSDGSFYVMGVRPGRYLATVEERVQDLLSLSVQPAEFEVLPTSDGAIVEGVVIRAGRD